MRKFVGIAVAMCCAVSAFAQETPPPRDCAAAPAVLPAALAGWPERTVLAAAADRKQLGGAVLTIGKGVDATLGRTGDVRYVVRPEKPGGSVSYGGMFLLKVESAGTYRVAIGSGAWIDMLRDGKPVISSAHGHGPECSGIHKMVDFPLEAGDYVLQIAANGTPTLPMLVARLP